MDVGAILDVSDRDARAEAGGVRLRFVKVEAVGRRPAVALEVHKARRQHAPKVCLACESMMDRRQRAAMAVVRGAYIISTLHVVELSMSKDQDIDSLESPVVHVRYSYDTISLLYFTYQSIV